MATKKTSGKTNSSGGRGKSRAIKPQSLFFTIVLLVIAAVIVFYGDAIMEALSPKAAEAPEATAVQASAPVPTDGKKLDVNVIDVGQGDSILIITPNGKNILIDAGESTAEEAVSAALDAHGIRQIDLLVATHPHSDHIGGMKHIVDNYEIKTACLPKVAHATKTYEKLIKAIKAEGCDVVQGKAGAKLDVDEAIAIDVLGPVKDEYSNINNYSVVMRITYGSTKFLFTGDAEHEALEDIMEASPDMLQADVLKVSHHGSSTGTSRELLKLVKPKYGLISLGVGNKYGHPHKEALQYLSEYNVEVYRTDKLGTIKATSDGSKIYL